MTPPARPPALWPYLLLNAVAATALDFTRLHELQTSDSLIFTLAGLYEWRPFFWEQDRVGMFWSLLLSWCDHPLAFLLLHTWVTTFLGLVMPVLFARVVTPNPAGPLVATLGNAAALAVAPPVVIDNWLIACNYPGALALCFLAVLLLDGRGVCRLRLSAAAVLLTTAYWQYLGVVLFFVPLVAVRGAVRNWAGGWWRSALRTLTDRTVVAVLTITPVALGMVFGLMEYVRRTDPSVIGTTARSLEPALWLDCYGQLIAFLFREPGVPASTAVFGVVVAGCLAVGLRVARREVSTEARAVLPVAVAAAGEFAFLGTRFWVWNNTCHPRYLVAVGTGGCLSLLLVSLAPLLGRLTPRRFRAAGAVAGGLLLVVIPTRFGCPSPAVPRAVIDERFGRHTSDILAADVDAVAGDYWRVWPAVFHANLVRHERGGGPVIWGVCRKCGVWRGRWEQLGPDGFRAAVTDADDPAVMAYHHGELDWKTPEYRLHYAATTPVGRVSNVLVFRLTPR